MNGEFEKRISENIVPKWVHLLQKGTYVGNIIEFLGDLEYIRKMLDDAKRDFPEVITAYEKWSTKEKPHPWVNPEKAAEAILKWFGNSEQNKKRTNEE